MADKINLSTLDSWYKSIYEEYKDAGVSVGSSSGLSAGAEITAAKINELINRINATSATSGSLVYYSYADWTNKPTTATTLELISKTGQYDKIDNQLDKLTEICANNTVNSTHSGDIDNGYSFDGKNLGTNVTYSCNTNVTYETVNETMTTYNSVNNMNCKTNLTTNATTTGETCITYGTQITCGNVRCGDDTSEVTKGNVVEIVTGYVTNSYTGTSNITNSNTKYCSYSGNSYAPVKYEFTVTGGEKRECSNTCLNKY